MARKALHADGVNIYFCHAGHLHISLRDKNDDEIAETYLEFTEGGHLVLDLNEKLEKIVASQKLDTIGPTQGNA